MGGILCAILVNWVWYLSGPTGEILGRIWVNQVG